MVVFLAAISSAFGQTEAQANAQPDRLLAPGLVIEELNRKLTPHASGLREGDVLLRWSRGGDAGTLDSPFSFMELIFEQLPKGSVTLWGLHGAERRRWDLPLQSWGISVRPNFTAAAFKTYLEGQELERSGNIAEAQRTWDEITAKSTTRVPWLGAWLKYKAAQAFSKLKRSRETDQSFEVATRESEADLYNSALLWMLWSYDAWFRGEPDLAFARWLKALEKAKRIGRDTFLTATILGWMSLSARQHGNLDEATRLLEDSYALEQKLNATKNSAIFALAADAFYRGDLTKAEFYYRSALSNSRKHHTSSNLSVILGGLGIVAHVRGELETAERYFQLAVKAEQRQPTAQIGLAVGLENLGIVSIEQGHFAKAEQYFLRSIGIEKEIGNTDAFIARNWNHLGDLARRQGNLVKAEELLQKALLANKQFSTNGLNLAWSYSDLGDVFLARGDLDNAAANHREARTIRERLAPGTREHAESVGTLASISRIRGQFDEAATLYKNALGILEAQTSRLGGNGDTRAKFRAKNSSYYREYADLLLAQNKPEEAFSVIERSRARTLLETLNAGHIDIQAGADVTLVQLEFSLRTALVAKSERRARLLAAQHTEEQIKAVEKEISDLTSEYQDVEAQIRSTSPAYAALTQPQPLTAKEIQQQLLDQDTMLLEYSLGEERSFVFAVTPDSIHAYELPKKAEIEQLARKVHRLLAAQRTVVRGESPTEKRRRMIRAGLNFDRAVAELSRMVLGPLAEQLKNKRLLVVTDGALAYVPFSLLPEPRAPDAAQPGDPVPLIVNHEIVNLPSASVLAVLRQQEKGRNRATKAVAVLADPVFDRHDPRLGGVVASRTTSALQTRSGKRDSLDELLAADTSANLLTRSATDLGLARGGQLALPRLRFSRQEADAILQVTPRGEGLEAVDFNANRATAINPELSQYRVVHFATHGLLNSEHPELSGLVLSLVDKKGKPQNGFLTLQDIYNLNLPADLVVLSACETGLGKEISGEGLIGLTRGFMYAGATRVVASLWKVSDSATAQLMAEFYRAMEKDSLAPAAALRAAQIAMWKQKRWRHPYYWAAFQIQGEWK